jgi:hypothetical protein
MFGSTSTSLARMMRFWDGKQILKMLLESYLTRHPTCARGSIFLSFLILQINGYVLQPNPSRCTRFGFRLVTHSYGMCHPNRLAGVMLSRYTALLIRSGHSLAGSFAWIRIDSGYALYVFACYLSITTLSFCMWCRRLANDAMLFEEGVELTFKIPDLSEH